MALIYHPNIRQLYAYRGLFQSGLSTAVGITVYSGTQPLASAVAANYAAYNSSVLWHTQGVIFSLINTNTTIFASTIPAAVNAAATGTGTWCIIWTSNTTLANVQSSTLVNQKFIVADVGNTTTSATLRFTTTAFTSGSPSSIIDCGITIF